MYVHFNLWILKNLYFLEKFQSFGFPHLLFYSSLFTSSNFFFINSCFFTLPEFEKPGGRRVSSMQKSFTVLDFFHSTHERSHDFTSYWRKLNADSLCGKPLSTTCMCMISWLNNTMKDICMQYFCFISYFVLIFLGKAICIQSFWHPRKLLWPKFFFLYFPLLDANFFAIFFLRKKQNKIKT